MKSVTRLAFSGPIREWHICCWTEDVQAISSILVIDDDGAALETISHVLSALGVADVCEVTSAERALKILRARQFDLIIADYRLGGMDGVEFLERLRAAGNQTPLLLLSGAPDKAGVIRATNQPKVDFFGKPFRVAELVGAMNKLVCA